MLIADARAHLSSVDFVVHIEYVDALVHDANMVVMVAGEEVELGAQLFGDQRIHLIDFDQKHDDFRAAVQRLASRQCRDLDHTALAADELRLVRFHGVKCQQRWVGLKEWNIPKT